MLRIQFAKRDFVVGVQNHGDCVMLAHTHAQVDRPLSSCSRSCPFNLRREQGWIGREIAKEPVKIAGSGARKKPSSTPVMEETARHGCHGDALNNWIVLSLWVGRGSRDEPAVRCVLRSEAGFHRSDISIEGGVRGGGRLRCGLLGGKH